MTFPRKEPPPRAAEARALYQAGAAITDIVLRTGISHAMVYYWIDRRVGPDGVVTLDPQPRRRPEAAARSLNAARRRKLANRIWSAAEAQVGEIETRLAGLGSGVAPAEAERDVRALAVLARVVRELAALDTATAKQVDSLKTEPAKSDPPKDEDARAPNDLDTFRRELARRLDALRGDGPD